MRNIIGSFAQFENDVKSERTIIGMKQAIQEGRYCGPAPTGYSNSRDKLDKAILTLNDESKYTFLRLNAIKVLGDTGDERALPDLQNAREENLSDIRQEAELAIKKIKKRLQNSTNQSIIDKSM